MGYALRRMWPPQRVASLLWNQWQLCRGMRGNFAMESVASFAWNQWQLSYGTGGNFRAEYAHSIKQTEHGDIPFHYTQLSELKHTIPPPQSMPLNLAKKVKVISASGEYEVGLLTLLHASADFNHRSRWQVGVKKVEMDNHFLPRVGMKCRYLLEHGDTRICSSSYAFHPERIEFSETDEREKSLRHYILERIDDNRSKISIDVYIEKTASIMSSATPFCF
jgi:hypothetical protein